MGLLPFTWLVSPLPLWKMVKREILVQFVDNCIDDAGPVSSTEPCLYNKSSIICRVASLVIINFVCAHVLNLNQRSYILFLIIFRSLNNI